MEKNFEIQCRAMAGTPVEVTREIMWMPGGLHAITAMRGDGTWEGNVLVNRETARVAQESLEAHNKESAHKPFFDFDHMKATASAWPTRFSWKDSPAPGVYVEIDWSKAGREAVEGKEFRAFSPTFCIDDASPAQVKFVPLNMGGLVNNPAFKKISPLWAKDQTEEGLTKGAQPNRSNMNETELAALKAKLQQLETENAELRAKRASSESTLEISAKNEEIAQLKQAVGKYEGEFKARRKADAETAVNAAVARGAIPAKDEAIQAKWRGLIESDPANQSLLATLPGNNAAQPITAAQGAGGRDGGRLMITREDTGSVIKGYIAAGTPKQRGRIYADEISARLAGGENINIRSACEAVYANSPIEAANALGTLAGALVLQRALELLRYELPVLSRISTNLSDESIKWNQTVNVQKMTPPAVTAYSTSTGYANSDITATDVPVTINNHKAVQVKVNVQDLAATNRMLLDEQATPIAYALAEDLTAALWALLTAANYANVETQAQNGFVRNTVILMGTALTKAKVPRYKRTLVLNPDYYGELAKDTTLVAIQNNPDAAKSITTGKLPDLHGFALIEAGNLPGLSENLTGVAFTPAAFLLATRVPTDYTQVFPGANAGAQVQVITDPDTGLSLMNVKFINHTLAEAYSRAAWMYGVAKGDTVQARRLKSS